MTPSIRLKLERRRSARVEMYMVIHSATVTRELLAARREAHRLQTIVDHATELAPDKTEDEATALWSNFQQRLDDTNRNIQQLEGYLESAGWNVATRDQSLDRVLPSSRPT